MCGLHFTLQLNVIFKFKSLLVQSLVIRGIECLTHFKIKISANLRGRQVWTTCLQDEVLTCGNTRHPSVGLFVPFCEEPQEWRTREITTRNIARTEAGSMFLNNEPLSDAVSKYIIKAIIDRVETEVIGYGKVCC